MAKTVKAPKPVLYRHTSHADWGLGMIVEEVPNKIYLAFEDGGRRPFLSAPKYRELLVPVELEAKAAEEIAAKLSKHAAKPVAKTAKKPKKKPAASEPEAEEISEGDDRELDEEEDE